MATRRHTVVAVLIAGHYPQFRENTQKTSYALSCSGTKGVQHSEKSERHEREDEEDERDTDFAVTTQTALARRVALSTRIIRPC
eukprot:m.12285 g.12285  ORF g.12285 m.12285 type:complete len:84 (-) comp4529_c0_seq1:727-978(-)